MQMLKTDVDKYHHHSSPPRENIKAIMEILKTDVNKSQPLTAAVKHKHNYGHIKKRN